MTSNKSNNKQDNDPWKNKKYTNKKKKEYYKKKIKKFFQNFFLKFNFLKKNNKNTQYNNINTVKIDSRLIGILVIFLFLIWVGSGFYTVKESDRGVVFRFGKYHRTVEPGLNWRPNFIEKIIPVNIEIIREQITNGMMLTSDENVIQVEMNVQYRVNNPAQYLFNVVDPDNSLREATDSAVRGIIGQSIMEQVLTEKRSYIRDETQKELENTIKPYNMGITILDVNFQSARPPDAVKAAFDDVIAAREEEEKTIREAQAYSNEVLPLAKGNAQKLIEEAMGYKSSVVFKAEGEVASFMKILPEYKFAPKITKERLYIETMENILSNTKKVIVNEESNSIILLSLDKKTKNEENNFNKTIVPKIVKNENNIKKFSDLDNYIKKEKNKNHNLIRIGR